MFKYKEEWWTHFLAAASAAELRHFAFFACCVTGEGHWSAELASHYATCECEKLGTTNPCHVALQDCVCSAALPAEGDVYEIFSSEHNQEELAASTCNRTVRMPQFQKEYTDFAAAVELTLRISTPEFQEY